MTFRLTRRLAPVLALLLLVGGVFALSNHTVSAQDAASSIKVTESSVTSEFPEGYRIKVATEAENDIKQIAVRMRIGQRTREVYEYMGDEGGEEGGGRGKNARTDSRQVREGRTLPTDEFNCHLHSAGNHHNVQLRGRGRSREHIQDRAGAVRLRRCALRVERGHRRSRDCGVPRTGREARA